MDFLENLSAIKQRYADAPLGKFQQISEYVVPTTPEDVGLAIMGGPFGRIGKLGGLALAGMGYSPEADAGLIRLGKEGIRKWLNTVNDRLDDDGLKDRALAIVREMPHTAEAYSPTAVSTALQGSDQLRGISPAQFLQLAYPLDYNDEVLDTVEHYKNLVRDGKWSDPRPGLFKDWYLTERRSAPYEGFSDVPFLTMREEPFSWKTVGHEGRHRMNVLGDLYGMQEPTLARIKDVTRKYPSIVESEKGGYGLDLSRTKRYAKGGLAQVSDMSGKKGPCGCSCDTCAKRGTCERAK